MQVFLKLFPVGREMNNEKSEVPKIEPVRYRFRTAGKSLR